MKRTLSIIALFSCSAVSSQATLTMWQAAVGTGTTTASTNFTTVSGTAPVMQNVGALTGARTFEFIVNAGNGGASSALLGSRAAGNSQGLKFEQWSNTGTYGITDFGIADINSGVAHTLNTDIHLVFASDGTDTDIFVNGASAGTMPGTDLTLTGTVGLGAALNTDGINYFDVLDGNILGFASYDSELGAAEIQTHSDAFFAPVPEPSAAALLGGLGLFAAILRRRR